ncbi:MAG: cytochrome c [Pricia sp.]|nr:cytochrome c [Pricia sp.]
MEQKRLICIVLIAFQLVSCEYHVENEEIVDDSCTPAVSFSAFIRPLIDTNCMPCHNGDGTEPFAPNLTTYASVESISELVKEVTQSRRMPKEGTLTDAQIEAIACWVDNGALNN